jgi:zinc transport system ATP-binding protein
MEGHEPSGEAAALARADRPLARPVVHDQGDHDHHDHPHYDGPALAHDAGALISARSLWLSRSGRTILQGVDIDIAAGEIVTLIGPNGAGKTTLLRVLVGLESPDKGKTVRKPGLVVGYVPQRFEVDRAIPLTVARFVGLGRGAEDDDIARVLGEVGAGQLGGASAGTLGRRAAAGRLARALVRSPNVLVLDRCAASTTSARPSFTR